ncbi:synaptosomal-associated protein 29 [Anabrus simplex]|uniref:synaptosomal-associated protein 29 n=1 Tax=Anabrus simplex TaxID=316456 RepID=UPI0035A3102D
MAGSQYLSNPKNPFFSVEDDDVDDETFLRNSRVRDTNPLPYQNQERAYLEQKHQELLERKRMIEERTIQSSERSIGLLRDSEQIGVATAEELIRQREQLERTERRLDDINTTLRFSQKHIQGIKSVFGSLKNYLSGKSGDAPPPASRTREEDLTSSESCVNSPLTGIVEKTRSMPGMSAVDSHPGMKIRGLAEEPSYSQPQTSDVQAVLNKNLDEMLGSVTRLKGFATALGEEIDSQNDLLENIHTKAEKADMSIQKQNKDMARILKK